MIVFVYICMYVVGVMNIRQNVLIYVYVCVDFFVRVKFCFRSPYALCAVMCANICMYVRSLSC